MILRFEKLHPDAHHECEQAMKSVRELKVGDRVIAENVGYSRRPSTVGTIARVTQTQITLMDGSRWTRDGRQWGAGTRGAYNWIQLYPWTPEREARRLLGVAADKFEQARFKLSKVDVRKTDVNVLDAANEHIDAALKLLAEAEGKPSVSSEGGGES